MAKRFLSLRLVGFAAAVLTAAMGTGLGVPALATRAGAQEIEKGEVIAGLEKLQFNVWNVEDGITRGSLVILYFDPADPTAITGGSLTYVPGIASTTTFEVVSGFLHSKNSTSAPGDFTLQFVTNPIGNTWMADVALDVLADGTIDLRGISGGLWPSGYHLLRNPYVLEGTGKRLAAKVKK